MSVRWFNADCAVVGSYRVKDIWYLQGRCTVEGKTATIPLMLDLRGDRLVVGWNREPVIEMQRCRAFDVTALLDLAALAAKIPSRWSRAT